MKKTLGDRRRTGVTSTKITDGNGGHFDLVSASWSKVKLIATTLSALAGVAALVFAAVRFGVATEVHQQIDDAAVNPRGAIHMQIDHCVEEHAREYELKLDAELKTVEDEIDRVGDAAEALTVKQEAMSEQIDQNHEEIMRMLRAQARGDTS